MRFAYDIIGNKERAVALLGVDLKEDELELAKEIMKRHKNVKSVLRKMAQRQEIYRLYPVKHVLGEENTEVIHKEHNYLLKLDPKKVYFSPREATERQRISEMVKEGERILVMFSGIAPYALAIAKKKPLCNIVCIDLNWHAIKYAEENVKLNGLNKLNRIKNMCADVREVKDLGNFDRIVMPLPEKAVEYIDVAFALSKKGTMIHLYGLSKEGTLFKDLERKIKENTRYLNVRYKIVKKTVVLPYAPRLNKVRLDIKIL